MTRGAEPLPVGPRRWVGVDEVTTLSLQAEQEDGSLMVVVRRHGAPVIGKDGAGEELFRLHPHQADELGRVLTWLAGGRP